MPLAFPIYRERGSHDSWWLVQKLYVKILPLNAVCTSSTKSVCVCVCVCVEKKVEEQALVYIPLYTHCLLVVWLGDEQEEGKGLLTSAVTGGPWGLFVPCVCEGG